MSELEENKLMIVRGEFHIKEGEKEVFVLRIQAY